MALNLLMWVPAARALACSCTEEYLSWTLPADGAVGVPTDVVIWAGAGLVDTWRLQTDAGDEVPVKAEQVHPSFSCTTGQWQLTPTTPLEPQTRYELQMRWLEAGVPASVTFTTGDGPLEDVALEAPEGIELAFMEPEGQCCVCFVEHSALLCDRGGPGDEDAEAAGTVLELTVPNPAAPPSRVAEFEELFESVTDVDRPPSISDLVMFEFPPTDEVRRLLIPGDHRRIPFAVPPCVELRYRAANGSRSAPLRLCGDELPVVPFSETVDDCETLFAVVDGDLMLPPKPASEKQDAGTGTSSRDSDAPEKDERAAQRADGDADGVDSKHDRNDERDSDVAMSSGGCGVSGGSRAPLGWLPLWAAALLISMSTHSGRSRRQAQ